MVRPPMNLHRHVAFFSLFVCVSLARPGDVPPLRGFVLGEPDQPAVDVLAAGDAGQFTVTGGGRDASGHMDAGSFAGFQTDALNFTFTARIARAGEGGPLAKYGIVARAGLAGNDKAVSLRHDGFEGHRCLQWFMRYHVVSNTHQGSRRCFLDGTVKHCDRHEDVWLRLVRRYPYVDLYASEDGTNWELVPYKALLQSSAVWVGLQVTAGDTGTKRLAVTFDDLSFSTDKGDGTSADTPGTFEEYAPVGKRYTIYFAKLDLGKAGKPAYASAYVIVPVGMNPKDMRCLLWTPASKEIATAGGGTLEFRSGARNTPEAGLRLPADFDKDEGAYHIDRLDPIHAMYEHYGMLRMGTLHRAYPQALKRLTEVSGIAEIEHLPFVSTGASAAGGSASRAAREFPDFAVASSPTLIGPAGIRDVEEYAHVPLLFIIGSRDGRHLMQILDAAPTARRHHALWGSAPMWFVYHHTQKQKALMYPYFAECIRLRVPADHDFATGPAKLKALKEEIGYLGLIDTWDTDFPQAVPFKAFTGGQSKTVWLPTALAARTWQAFVSHNPRTVIQFPMFEGHSTIGQPQPNGWHNSHLAAGTPFEIAASGPIGKDVKVKFYADLEPIRALKRAEDNPYRLRAAGLPPGLHVLYAITTVNGVQEISRPVTVMFHRRAGMSD